MKNKDGALRWGLAIFLTVSAILLFYDTLFGRRVLLNITRQFLRALQPVIIGGLLAYLLAPAIDFIEDALFSGRLKISICIFLSLSLLGIGSVYKSLSCNLNLSPAPSVFFDV